MLKYRPYVSSIEFERKKSELEFEKALELRNFEISLFWQRAWFFGALLVAIITGYIELRAHEKTIFCIYLSFLAFLVSLAQCLMNRGSKYWQERWEYHAKHKESILKINVTKTDMQFKDDSGNYYDEKNLIEAYILCKGEMRLLRGARFSVSKLAILVWDIITFFLFTLWLHDVYDISGCSPFIQDMNIKQGIALLVHSVVIFYVVSFCKKYQFYEPLGEHLKPNQETNYEKGEISRRDLQNIYPAGKLEEL